MGATTSVGLALQVHAYCYASIGLLYVIIAPNGLGRHDKTSIYTSIKWQVQFKTELILHAISNSTHHIIQAKLIVAKTASQTNTGLYQLFHEKPDILVAFNEYLAQTASQTAFSTISNPF